MSHEFLRHLTQAKLPVIIYSENLVDQLRAYELQGLLITAEAKSFQDSKYRLKKGVRVVKITRAGRHAVHRHIKASQRHRRESGME
jgi:hypothetical protein